MDDDALPYDRILQDAMRDVLRKALEQVARSGLPGAHHFYITFRTGHPGVKLAERLRASYPDEMTIVLQHQFQRLGVHPAYFEVTLSFKQRLERLRVPFAAIVSFVDPSVNFGLQFQADRPEEPGDRETADEAQGEPAPTPSATPAAGEPPAEKVVSLDAFRKR